MRYGLIIFGLFLAALVIRRLISRSRPQRTPRPNPLSSYE